MTHGLVLSGGGAFAAFEVGVLKAMASGECPVNWGDGTSPKIVAGASAGSFNGAVLLSHPGGDLNAAVPALEKIWLERIAGDTGPMENGIYRLRFDPFGLLSALVSPQRFADQVRNIAEDSFVIASESLVRAYRIFNSKGSLVRRVAENVDFSIWLSTERYSRLVREVVRARVIRESRHKLLISVTDWKCGRLRLFHNEHMTDRDAPLLVEASSAIPGVFPPVRLGRQVLVDGGVVMNTPLRPAIDNGADVISVIELLPDVSAQPAERADGILSVLDRMLAVASNFSIKSDVETARRVNHELDDPGEIGNAHRSRRHRKVSIHRFRPACPLGSTANLLNMSAANLADFIRRGYEIAQTHDCRRSECVIAH